MSRNAPKKAQAVALVASGHTQADAAQRVGVHPKTVMRWLQSADGQLALAAAERSAYQVLCDNAERAAEVLAELADHGGKDDGARVAAAKALGITREGLHKKLRQLKIN